MQTFRSPWIVQVHGQVFICSWRSRIEKPNICSLSSYEQNGGRSESNEWIIDAYSFLNRYEWCKQYESILGHHGAKLDALSIKYVHGPLKSEYAYDELSSSGSLKLVVSSGNNAKLIHANVDAKLIHGNASNGCRVSKLIIGYLFQIIWEIVRWLSAFRQ